MINLGLEKIVLIKDIFCGKTRKQNRRNNSWVGLEGPVEYRDGEERLGALREGRGYKQFGRQKERTHLALPWWHSG